MSYFERECYCCTQHETQLEEIKDWFEEVVEQLYGHGALDISNLDNALDELAHRIGSKIPKTDLQIQRSSQHPMKKTFDLDSWKDWNNQYLKKLANS